MPKHLDFQEIFENFIDQYGEDRGEEVYFAWLHNEDLDDTKSLASQGKNRFDNWKDGLFVDCYYKKYSKYLKFHHTDNEDIQTCGCSDPSCNSEHKLNYYTLKDEFKDAIAGNTKTIQKNLNDFLLTEEEKYKLIVDKWMDTFYNDGIQSAAKELVVTPAEFSDLRGQKQQIKILQENSQQLVFNLFDDIGKEVGLLLTDISLNNIPISNPELKKEIQDIFRKKDGRLQSQVTSETDRAFNVALEFGYKKSGLVTHKQWVAIIDGKTSQVCQILNGEIVEIGKPFSLGFFQPPAHVNCRSRIQAVTLTEKE